MKKRTKLKNFEHLRNHKFQRKSQAAMEFLSNYGWAILVTLFVIGALTYADIFNPENFLPSKCEFFGDIKCIDFHVHADGKIQLHLGNNLENKIEIVAIRFNSTEGLFNCINSFANYPPSSRFMNLGGKNTYITRDCRMMGADIKIGKRLYADMEITYKDDETKYQHTIPGAISFTVEGLGPLGGRNISEYIKKPVFIVNRNNQEKIIKTFPLATWYYGQWNEFPFLMYTSDKNEFMEKIKVIYGTDELIDLDTMSIVDYLNYWNTIDNIILVSDTENNNLLISMYAAYTNSPVIYESEIIGNLDLLQGQYIYLIEGVTDANILTYINDSNNNVIVQKITMDQLEDKNFNPQQTLGLDINALRP